MEWTPMLGLTRQRSSRLAHETNYSWQSRASSSVSFLEPIDNVRPPHRTVLSTELKWFVVGLGV